MPWKNKIPLKTIYGTQVFKMSFIVKFASISINKQTNSCPVRKALRLSLLGMGCGFNSKLNMRHSEEQRHWHQKKRKKLTPGNWMYTTLVTRTTHIRCTNTFILRRKNKKHKNFPSFLNLQNECKAYLNSLSVLPLYMAPLPIPSKSTRRQRDVCKTNPK